ncbi:MAG: UDP-N-acetylmuramate dehydrogenase [Alphaproteobacteria bacterium]
MIAKLDVEGLSGRLAYDQPLAPITWFRVGGRAEILFQPRDEEDLRQFLKRKPPEMPLTIIGVGSNLLVRDGGVEGAVIRLGRDFNKITIKGTKITAGAAALDVMVAREAQKAGLAGLEFMRGIPGTVGGGLRMNAGAYGREFKDILKSARALDRAGNTVELSLADMKFTYRHSGAAEELIFVSASFEGTPDNPVEIQKRMDEITEKRESSQPVKSRTGGSTFKNPPGEKAWQLIDKAGCRGLKIGGAQVSEQHCNFLINTGDATAADLEALGEEVRRRVKASSGTLLEWEIMRLGRP